MCGSNKVTITSPRSGDAPYEFIVCGQAVRVYVKLGRCKTCEWWTGPQGGGLEALGKIIQRTCNNELLNDDSAPNGLSPIHDAEIETGPEFGCVHHKEREQGE